MEQFGGFEGKDLMEECVVQFVVLAIHVGFVFSFLCDLAEEVVVHCPFLVQLLPSWSHPSYQQQLTSICGPRLRRSSKSQYLFCWWLWGTARLLFWRTSRNLWQSANRLEWSHVLSWIFRSFLLIFHYSPSWNGRSWGHLPRSIDPAAFRRLRKHPSDRWIHLHFGHIARRKSNGSHARSFF